MLSKRMNLSLTAKKIQVNFYFVLLHFAEIIGRWQKEKEKETMQNISNQIFNA